MKNFTEEIVLKLSCVTFMQKECIAALLCEHLDEFKDLYFGCHGEIHRQDHQKRRRRMCGKL